LKILAIDTSGLQAGAAIVATEDISSYITVGEILLNARTGEKTWTHSEILMPGVEQLFALTRLQPKDIDYVAYTCGPGSFTGLRIGAASAIAIARALNKPAIPVPTLDALAYNALGVGSRYYVVPMLDARRGQIYTAIYYRNMDGMIIRDTKYMALAIEDFLLELRTYATSGRMMFFGDGADANVNVIREKFPKATFPAANNNRQRASSAAVWAAEKISNGYEFPDTSEIIYVRAPQAVREA
jgi:tRNA threonylcarbamoyladenosine biosynthesis protein TsaB